MATAAETEALAADARYGQWSSYVLTVREGLARAETLLPLAQTDLARRGAAKVIEANRKILAEMDALFPAPPSP